MFRWIKKLLFGPQEIIITVRGSIRLEGDHERSSEPYWDRELLASDSEQQSAILQNDRAATEEALPSPTMFTDTKKSTVSFGQDA